MGIFDKLFKSKEEKVFEKALKEKDYKRAVRIGNEYGLDKEKIRAAERKLAIREAIAQYNQDDASRELINNALKAVKDTSIAKKIPSKAKLKGSSVLRAIAFAQVRSGNIEHAVEIITQGIKDKEECSRALIEIAAVQRDNLSEAIETLQKMPYKELLSEILRDISVAQALSGNIEQAIKTAQNIPDERTRQISENIKEAMSLSGDLQEATEAAQKRDDFEKLMDIANKQAFSGSTKQAIETAKKISDPNISSNILRVFAMGYVWLDEMEQAVRIAQEIPDNSLRSVTLGEILMSYSKSSDDAIKIIKKIPDKDMSLMFLTDIAVRQLLLGDMEEVIRVVEETEDKDVRSEVLEVIAESIEALIEAQASIK
jgi:hypothetical protein